MLSTNCLCVCLVSEGGLGFKLGVLQGSEDVTWGGREAPLDVVSHHFIHVVGTQKIQVLIWGIS